MSRHNRDRRAARVLQVEELGSRVLPSASPVWTVVGDRNPAAPDDTISIRSSPQNADILQAVVNGRVVSARATAGLSLVRVFAGAGNDTVSIDVDNDASGFAVRVYGGAGNDRLLGHAGRDRLDGGTGNDILDGAGATDWLCGNAGNDTLHGGRGGDRIDGGAGDNTVFGRDTDDAVMSGTGRVSFLKDNSNPLHQVSSVSQLRDWIVKSAVGNWSGEFGRRVPTGTGTGTGMSPTAMPTAAPTGNGGEGDTGAGAGTNTASDPVSGTNTQEVGVDEADIVKTDGQYLYTVSGGDLFVVDVRSPDRPAVVGKLSFTGSAESLYLTGDRLVVLSRDYESGGGPMPIEPGIGGAADIAVPWWGYFKPKTVVTTVDVSDRTAPAVVHATTLDGSLVDSRAVGDRVYVVVENSLFLPQPAVVRTAAGEVYETEAAYRARVGANLADTLPGFSTSGSGDAGEGSLVDGADVYLPEVTGGSQLLSVAAFDPAAISAGPVAVTTVAGTYGEVYASTESLYVAATDYASPWRGGGETTQIYKFALDRDAVPLDALGSVNGIVLNQFSMDEEGGFFRIATTTGWGDEASNAVRVLSDTGTELEVVGALENLAVTERIQSVRFDGDTGYVVTFRQVDPLFVLNMADPTNPTVVGELKIPGFSSYLQRVGEGRLIGLGRDADPDTGRVRGLQLSLFDVSNPANPLRLDTYTFSTEDWGGSSEAEWDHHALSWFPDVGILALPVAVDWENPSSLEVLRVGADRIDALGQITHDSPVNRSLRIGGNLFSLSYDEVQVHNLTNPSVRVGGVALPVPPIDDGGPIVFAGGV